MSKMLSTVFHEVRNPLGVINLHAELIMKNPENAVRSAQIISRTSRDLEKILSELLAFSKPLRLEKTNEDIVSLIYDIVSLIRPKYEQKNVEMVFDNALGERGKLSFDRVKIYQALFNLLVNALEASEPGGKVIISLEKEEQSYLIKISDEGEGIPDEIREKIFEPYFTTKKQGSGIGLAETKKIIEAHEGDICIHNHEQAGTTFMIRLKGD